MRGRQSLRCRGLKRPPALGLLGAFLTLGLASAAAAAPIHVPAVQPPALPTPEGPAPVPSSFVTARIAFPLEPLRQALERALPPVLRAADLEERVTPEELLAEEHEENEERAEREREAVTGDIYWRGPIRRDPIRLEGRGDTLYASAKVSYAIAARGKSFGVASCGSASSPRTGEVHTLSRLGWSEGWRLETRSRSLPTTYATRCKPKPPGINFTKLVNDRVERLLATRLGPTLDSLAGIFDVSAQASALYTALGRPLPLAESGPWLLWHPTAVRAEWPRFQGDSVVVNLTVEARPEIVLAPDSTRAPLPSAPGIRLSGSDAQVPFDCWADLNVLGRRLVGLVAPTAGGDSIRVMSATLRGAMDRLLVELHVGGALDGRLFLLGTLGCANPSYVLEVPDLEWTTESRQALDKAVLATDRGAITAALASLRDQVRSRLRHDLQPCVASWDGALSRSLVDAQSNQSGLTAAFRTRKVHDVFCTDSAVGVRFVVLGRVRSMSGRAESARADSAGSSADR